MNPLIGMITPKSPAMSAMSNAMTGLGNVKGILSALRSGNQDAMFQSLYNSNPAFRDFYDKNKGKSPEQIMQENGISPDMVRQFLG